MKATIIAAALLLSVPARGITRDQVMSLAKAYVHHPWRCTAANTTGSCAAGYTSVFTPGDYLGVPYDWGGNATLFDFDQKIAQGYGAGTRPSDGVLSCTTGVDCSGYVSRCWGETTKYGTYTLENISTAIAQSQLLAGDVMNLPGTHVVLYSHTLPSGEPVWYEAGYYVTEMDVTGGWSKVSGYTPRRYNNVTGAAAGNPPGTTTNPIVIGSLPYTDSRDTSQSASDVFDGCGAAPTKDESGPEYIYKASFSQPGSLTVSVSCGPGVDIDVHLYGSLSTSDCVARNDKTFTQAVDCGTYYVVADTFTQNAGPYTLTVSFTPSGGSCGAGPPTYDPPGELGEPCASTPTPILYCNQTLGAEVCLLGPNVCTNSCKTSADCGAFPGGCCKAVQSGEYYCLPAAYCGGVPKDGGPVTSDGPVGPTPDGGKHDVGPVIPGDGGASKTDGGSNQGDGGLPAEDIGGGETGGGGDGGCALQRGSCSRKVAGLLLLGLLLLPLARRRSSDRPPAQK